MQLRDIIANTKTISLETLAQDTALAEEVQINLFRFGLLDPPVDGKFGFFSTQALKYLQSILKIQESGLGPQTSKALLEVKEAIPLNLSNDLASRIIKYMRSKAYFVAVGEKRYNIVYLEGASADGKPNRDSFNEWNDRRIVIEIATGTPKIVGNWLATTEPGNWSTQHPPNANGVARIAFGQYQAWQVGTHYGSGRDPHEALVQCGTVKVYRDRNKDGIRTGDAIDIGSNFFINQHWGFDMSKVEGASAGCLVGQSRQEHREFMRLIKQDVRYQLNNKYVLFTTIIPGDDLAKAFPAS
ncbi:peptidoglycan-binding protein [Planktothrix sp. FACHB-1355]|uniref:Peptidoglycan-binding protein n=1 Tax=Aerosakkonema funiforme FACHB-1375 TaxID=2949571 RepID=A0A926VE04_9CYAN|nr:MULTISPECIES: peptidoglycan-binding domain-containing protein [Oscillatoriales]MBD2182029.1 peptidoglycan-binding protein [Aerosakkonema funiforme FACHB-1375]MBD3558719.1 peptidoglycan-binding protein [Planktothrix sp. FACHB-1355]